MEKFPEDSICLHLSGPRTIEPTRFPTNVQALQCKRKRPAAKSAAGLD
jgi:hypothetical protein